MSDMACPATPKEALVARRRALTDRLAAPVLIAAGQAPARNYPANPYPYRASSHFLYFTGRPMAGAALLFSEGRCCLLAQPPDPDDALWHGPRPTFEQLADELGLDEVRSVRQATEVVKPLASLATLPPQDADTAAWLSRLLGREVPAGSGDDLEGPDAALADAMIALRLIHDEAAVAQLRFAAAVSVEAHLAGMRATRPGAGEQTTYAAMVDVFRRHGLEDAYPPIVTVHGEILHQHDHGGPTAEGDLLLADVGGESPEGWAADITRTWPVSGRYSGTQRAVYDVVLDAQRRAIAAATPGRRYRDVHETAKRALVEGLVELIEGQGSRVRLNAEVEEVLVEHGKAAGVRLRGGEQLRADIVVSNADSAYLYKHLVPARYRKRWTDKKIDRARYSMSLFVWYFGTKRKYEDVAHHTILLGPRYKGLLDDIFENKVLAEDFSLYLHRPTTTDPALAPAGCDTFYVLSPVPHLDADVDWDDMRQRYRDKICKYLADTVMPGLEHQIASEHILDPIGFRDELLSHKGAAFGVEPVLWQSAYFRPHNRSEEIDNLFIVGAGTHPGAGVPGVLSSAKVLEQVLPDADALLAARAPAAAAAG